MLGVLVEIRLKFNCPFLSGCSKIAIGFLERTRRIMQHIIVFSYIFTILVGVSAFTIQWLAGRGDNKNGRKAVQRFISMLLLLNVFDFVIYYFDNIVNRPSGNLMLSFGDCLIAVLVYLWLQVEVSFSGMEVNTKLLKMGQRFILVYLAVWLIAVVFFIEFSWIRLLIDIPLICLLVIGSAAIILQSKKDGKEGLTLAYEGVITFFLACNYVTYLVSESGLLLSTGKNIMDVTIFFWLGINAANLIVLYKKDFVESFLKEDVGTVQSLNLEDAMELVKQKYELTNREIEILTEVYDGKTNTQIAEDLFISESTVKAHIYNIFRKMNVKSRVEAVCIIREEKETKVK